MVSNSSKKVKVIVGGTLIDPSSSLNHQKNIFIENGCVAEIGDRYPDSKDGIVDATGLYVAPGFIDLHVHLREPGFEYKEDIKSGSKAAAAGGFTTIVCMPNTKPANDCAEVTKKIIARAKAIGLVDVLPVGAMTVALEGEIIPDYDAMIDVGVIAISDDGSCIQDPSVEREVFYIAKEKGILITSHPEIFSISKKGVINDGAFSRANNIPGIPRAAENGAIEREIALVRETGARLHLAHVSTKEGIEFVREAKMEGLPVTCEVTPHHLLLTENDVQKYGANAKMNPPLRTDEDRIALIAALQDGTVDAIATDHAPHSSDEKKDLLTAPFGIIGMETAFPVCMELVEDRNITLERLIELLTSSPAKIFGLGRGQIAPGMPADLTIIQKNISHKIDASRFQSKARNTPFDGWEVSARVVHTIKYGQMTSA